MKPSLPSRTPSRLSDSVQHQLNMYALAAGAAGIGMLPLAQPAEAKIIYTKAYEVIGPGTALVLDLNHDGITDFVLKDTFRTWGTSLGGGSTARLSVLPHAKKNRVRGHTYQHRYVFASALAAGVPIGPKEQFLPAMGLMAGDTFWTYGRNRPASSRTLGAWCGVADRYLGLKFVTKGEVHFGWARLNVRCHRWPLEVTGTLTGYAYETIPNKSIAAGKTKGPDVTTVQPVTLGALAAGSSADRPRRKS